MSHLELTEWMWDEQPEDALHDLGMHLITFRSWLGQLGLRHTLANRDGVCRLTVPLDQVDAHLLTMRVTEAAQLDDRTAAARLQDAFALCAGQPLAGLTGRRIGAYRQVLLEERRNAETTLIRVDCRLGHAEGHLADLVRLFRERPEDTDVVTLTMDALVSTGRRAEALAVYRRCSERMVELGMKVPQRMAELVPQLESHA